MGVIKYLISGELYKLRKYNIIKSYVYDYKNDPLHFLHTMMIHRRGFAVTDWDVCGIDRSNYKKYLTSRDYSKIHPINGYYSKIIDDKITIKYVLSGEMTKEYLPKYYYMIDGDGFIFPLMDMQKDGNPEANDIIDLLKDKKRLALKLVGGSIGKGFYKIEYADKKIYVNQNELSVDEFEGFIKKCKDYIISEYLQPHPDLAEFCPNTPNTLRYLVGRVGQEWRLIKSYIRFGTNKSGVVENFNLGGVLSYIDENGYYNGGYLLTKKGRKSYSIPTDEHPDTKKTLAGRIPCWSKVVNAAENIEKWLPQTKYLGLDFVITSDNQVKLLEINSLTSLDTMQIDGSILETDNGKWFFSQFNL